MSSQIRKGSKCTSFLGHEMSCLPDTFTDIEDDFETQIMPTHSLLDSDDLPLEFPITGNPEHYLLFGDSYIHIRIRVVKIDGTKVVATVFVTPVNLLAHALFNQIDVYINEQPVTKSSKLYALKAYIGTVCAYSGVAKKSWLENELYYEDSPGAVFDDVNAKTSKNGGLVVRNELAAESRTIDMVFKPHTELFMQNRPIPPSTDVRVRMVRSPSKFCLMTGSSDEYKVVITYACLHLRVLKMSHTVTLNHKESLLHDKELKYPVDRVKMTSFTVPQNVLSYTRQNVLHGQLPLFIIMGMTTNIAFTGSYTKSPFKFSPFNLTKTYLVVNGRNVPTRPYSLKFDDSDKTGMEFARCMRTLSGLLKPKYSDVGNGISREMYADGFTLIPFILYPTYDSGSLALVKEGTVQLEMEFGSVTSEVINVVLFIQYENTITIGRNGKVSIDF